MLLNNDEVEIARDWRTIGKLWSECCRDMTQIAERKWEVEVEEDPQRSDYEAVEEEVNDEWWKGVFGWNTNG